MTRTVIVGGDAVASITLGDVPYADIPIDPSHQPITVGRGSGAGSIGSVGRTVGLPDRSLTPEGAKAPPDPVLAAAFDAAVDPRVSVRAELSRFPAVGVDHLMLPLGATDSRGSSLAGMVGAARTARLVVAERAWFQSGAQFAQVVLGLCGAGVLVSVRDLAPLDGYLHPEVIDSLRFDGSLALSDRLQWGAISAACRRAAWLHHDRVLATDGVEWSLEPRRLPSVSVLLATNRPHYVASALEQIAAQSHPDAEVVLALHGIDDDANYADEFVRLGLEGRVLTVSAAIPLGQALNTAAASASGDLITKWDDDDLYGRHHLVDVCIGLRYSKAAMVGKAPEFIYFTENNTTVLRNHSGFESFSNVIAGGTITMPRVAFDDIGGFPPVPRAVDHYLKRAVLHAGMSIYRMHAFGFVLVRRGEGHTWTPDESELTNGTERAWVGIPSIADVQMSLP